MNVGYSFRDRKQEVAENAGAFVVWTSSTEKSLQLWSQRDAGCMSQTISTARAGIQHVMEVMQASDDGNNQKLQLWQEESWKYHNRVRSEAEKYGQVSTGVLTKQYTGATSALSGSYRSSTELHCLVGAGQTNTLKLTQASLISVCQKVHNLCHKHWY